MYQYPHIELVELAIEDVKNGLMTRESATQALREHDVYVGRGTDRRLLCAEADAILNEVHPNYRADLQRI